MKAIKFIKAVLTNQVVKEFFGMCFSMIVILLAVAILYWVRG